MDSVFNKSDYLSAINSRISRRTYTKTKISKEKVDLLKRRIDELNKESGLRAIWLQNGGSAFSSIKSYGMFKNVGSVIALKGLNNTADLNERAGYFGELLVLEATVLKLGTCWVAGTYNKSCALFGVEEGEEVVAVISIGNVPPEQTTTEKIIYRTIRHKTLPLEEFYTADKPVPDWFINGIKAVQRAPSAVNSQRVRFKYQNFLVSASIPDSRPSDLIDLGIAKLHFELGAEGKFLFGNGGSFKKEGI